MAGLVFDPGALTLLRDVDVRRALAGRELSFRVLTPPYPVLGVGALRVLRVAEYGERTEIVAGYERYERLPEG